MNQQKSILTMNLRRKESIVDSSKDRSEATDVANLFVRQSAVAQLFVEQSDAVVKWCRRWLTHPHEAEDACQEVFFRVARAWDRFRLECKVETWLYRITRNVCHNFNRSARRKRIGQALEYRDDISSHSIHFQDDSVQDQEVLYGRRQLSESIASSVRNLSETSQEILRLKIENGLTYEEVGERLGLPSGTIKSRVFRARNQIRDALSLD